jgi:hypothetical protein
MGALLKFWLLCTAVTSDASRIHPFTASSFFTKHKLMHHVVGDISKAEVLNAVVEHKSWKKEGAQPTFAFALNSREMTAVCDGICTSAFSN